MNIVLIALDTQRADHLGCYGYKRATSPRIDALAREGVLFEHAYTYWPKTRASFVSIHTGKTAAESGYGTETPILLSFNETIASLLKEDGYETAAIVDNANVAGSLGYSKGFDSFREVWEDREVKNEVDGAHAITREALSFLGRGHEHPFLLWLHYVNPHAPYTPPPPNDTAFLDQEALSGEKLKVVSGFHGGIPRPLFVSGHRNLAYYLAQYDGEIKTADSEIGAVLDGLSRSASAAKTDVVLLADHGESLGEHDYYFDHGEDLFEPCLRIPLVIKLHTSRQGSVASSLASTLDVLPTLLALGKRALPPGLPGRSLLDLAHGEKGPRSGRLFAQNDRGLASTWDERFTLIERPLPDGTTTRALYDRDADPSESEDSSKAHPREREAADRELDFFLGRQNQEKAALAAVVKGAKGPGVMTREACKRLKALGYVSECAP